MLELVTIGPELPSVARNAISAWVSGEARLQALRPGAPAAPVFVTLRTSDGNLRGCIGSLVASEADVVAETARSAVLAASRDPRFMPVTAAELGALSIEVSVLLPMKSWSPNAISIRRASAWSFKTGRAVMAYCSRKCPGSTA